ncbi:MAG: hypothetical protein WAM79_07720 [Candidatus Sulfotelmatobacter sp.]
MSYKIVDQIKKSSLPRTLKTVLEAYTSFGNKDGTSIRATEAAVGERASASARTVSRHTQPLVALGLLVHDTDEHGIYLKHAYGEKGVWAYVYHIDASKLRDPVLTAQWEAEYQELLEKRRIAGAKNTKTKWAKETSGNPSGQNWWNEEIHRMTLSKLSITTQSKMAQTTQTNLSQTHPEQIVYNHPEQIVGRTLPSDPRSADPSDTPSARSRAVDQNRVSELVSEENSVASLPHTSRVTSKEQTYDQHSPLWMSAEEFFNSIWPNKPIRDEDIILLLDLAKECCHGDLVRGGERLKAAWEWNQVHKKGKWKLFSLAELAKALRSPSDRNLLAQMDADQGCPLCTPEEESEPKPLGWPAQESHEHA